MRRSSTIALPVLLAVAAGAAALLVVKIGGESAVVDRVAEETDASGVRLVGNAPPVDVTPVEDLVRGLTLRESWDGEIHARLKRRAAGGASVVEQLLALLRLGDEELRQRGLNATQVLDALEAIGEPTAEGLARAWLDPGVDYTDDILRTLTHLGPDAAPAVPLVLEAIQASEERLDLDVIRFFASVGEGSQAAVPLLMDLVAPPVRDHLAGATGDALLAIAEPRLGGATIAALARLPGERARKVLLVHARSSDCVETKLRVVRALERALEKAGTKARPHLERLR